MDTYEASKSDRLSQSLSNAWASFLGAQHCTQEIGALRKTLDEHVQQTALSVASLQRDAGSRHSLVTTALSECKARAEQHDALLREFTMLQTGLSVLRQDVIEAKEELARNHGQLSERVEAQQKGAEALHSATSRDIQAVQEKHRSALETIETLQRELRVTKEENTALEQRLAAIESRIEEIGEDRQELPAEMRKFLDYILSRRDELSRLLDTPYLEIQAKNSSQASVWLCPSRTLSPS
jgi:chromosome segregation ATPase